MSCFTELPPELQQDICLSLFKLGKSSDSEINNAILQTCKSLRVNASVLLKYFHVQDMKAFRTYPSLALPTTLDFVDLANKYIENWLNASWAANSARFKNVHTVVLSSYIPELGPIIAALSTSCPNLSCLEIRYRTKDMTVVDTKEKVIHQREKDVVLYGNGSTTLSVITVDKRMSPEQAWIEYSQSPECHIYTNTRQMFLIESVKSVKSFKSYCAENIVGSIIKRTEMNELTPTTMDHDEFIARWTVLYNRHQASKKYVITGNVLPVFRNMMECFKGSQKFDKMPPLEGVIATITQSNEKIKGMVISEIQRSMILKKTGLLSQRP